MLSPFGIDGYDSTDCACLIKFADESEGVPGVRTCPHRPQAFHLAARQQGHFELSKLSGHSCIRFLGDCVAGSLGEMECTTSPCRADCFAGGMACPVTGAPRIRSAERAVCRAIGYNAARSDTARLIGMIQDIEQIEYRSGPLAAGAKPASLAAMVWRGGEIPSDVRKAIVSEDLLDLGGTYGERVAGRPVEYDHLRIVLAKRAIDIEVYDRLGLLADGDAKFMRVHRMLCKLNRAIMSVPDMFTAAQRVGADPRLPLPPGGKFTYRDQANVLTLLAFRNGPIEDLHAGKCSPLLDDPSLSRITDEEMKALMIAASARLAELLALRDSDPEEFARLLTVNWRQVKNWER